jgi:APA family basic amino acid/polyamine antiporter
MQHSRSTSSSPSARTLIPTLGLFTTVAIVAGSVIGSGIFRKPSLMAAQLGQPELLLLVWVLAGVLTLFGALTNAEVAGIISATGGQYVFFQKMYGNFVAFMYGWAALVVIQSGSIASVVYVFAEYSQYFVALPRYSPAVEHSVVLHLPFIGDILPLHDIGVKSVAVAVIWLLTAVNYVGVRFGGLVQGTFTTLKLAAILLLMGAAFVFAGGSTAHFTSHFTATSTSATPTALPLASDANIVLLLVAALAGAFWTYDGWNNITYVAGEVKNPSHTIPRALMLAMGIVISVYVGINLAYLYVLPVPQMAGSKLVAADVATLVMGSGGGAFVAAAVMISTFGTSNGTILVCARVYYAMAKDKLFFPAVGTIHPRFHTPNVALLLQAVWASVLVLSGTFDMLTNMLIFIIWIFYALGAFGVFILRRTMPDEQLATPRPYKVWGYPVVPAVFVLFATCYVLITLYNDVTAYMAGRSALINSVLGLALVFSGVPLYLYFRSRSART